MDEKDFFVGIYEPTDVRRNILESSKEIVESLQSNSKLTKIRNEKILLYDEMRKIMGDLDLLISKLNHKLPRTHLRKETSEGKIHPEMTKLEKELRSLETEFSKI